MLYTYCRLSCMGGTSYPLYVYRGLQKERLPKPLFVLIDTDSTTWVDLDSVLAYTYRLVCALIGCIATIFCNISGAGVELKFDLWDVCADEADWVVTHLSPICSTPKTNSSKYNHSTPMRWNRCMLFILCVYSSVRHPLLGMGLAVYLVIGTLISYDQHSTF